MDILTLAKELRANLDDLGDFLVAELARELIEQGHKATGRLAASIEQQVVAYANGIALEIKYLEYGRYVETGVSADRIPYGKKTGAKTSKYIQALIEWIKIKGIASGLQAKGLAFGIARKHAQEGMPTRGSYNFSNNGRRKGFQSYVVQQNAAKIDELLQDGLAQTVSAQLDLLIANITK